MPMLAPSGALELRPCRAAPQAAKAWARLPQDRAVAARAARGHGVEPLEIAAAAVGAALADALGDVGDDGMQGHGASPVTERQWASSNQVRPSRSISAIAAVGPQLPAR